MDQIEPNVGALAAFSLAWAVCCLGGLLVLGMFPLSARPATARRPSGLLLIAANTLVLITLLTATFAYGARELRWSSLIVAGGVVFLFTPGLFQVVPERWRDGPGGLAAMLALSIAALVLLYRTGAIRLDLLA